MNTTIEKTELKSFHYVFQLSKTILFNVNYYRFGNNSKKHFSTSADQFNKPKSDYSQGGQAQETLLKGYSTAMSFYKKFDPLHLHDLTDLEYSNILAGIDKLKAKYNYLQSDDNNRSFAFSEVREFSKITPKPQ